MKKILFIFVLASLSLNGQNSEEDSYYPLIKGMSKTLTWYASKYREVVKDSVLEENGKYYTLISQIFPPNETIDIYMRKSNDTVYFYNEAKHTDVPFFGINPKIGETIGKGTVIDVDAKLKTPKGKLTELLVVEMNYSKDSQDIRYYKKGIGLVAVKNKRRLICYYVPD